jgi:D-beta-D-heptose 7-phosphate kinase/D-beta-D-heptose 1-phosphate adenosyltransferase
MYEIIKLLQNTKRPRIAVIGDVMLDRYVWGDAERISQEAPVVLLRADRREERLGGAGSVAMMLSALDVDTTLIGVIGCDHNAEKILELLNDNKINSDYVLHDSSRITTVKERYIGKAQTRHPQQILRVDYEERHQISNEIESIMINYVVDNIDKFDAVLISDYNKGVCTSSLLYTVIYSCKKIGCPIIADPVRGGCYSKYTNCTLITPNRLEASLATGIKIDKIEDAIVAAVELQKKYKLDASLITLDKDGIVYADARGNTKHYATRPRQVYDITGAGDMVMASIGLALAYRASYPLAIQLANIAGGLQVERIGATPVTRNEIIADIIQTSNSQLQTTQKILSLEQLVLQLQMRRSLGQKIALTNGCFDILHLGHVQYLSEARQLADCLVVGLNSDNSVRTLKGQGRPIYTQTARACMLAALSVVDYVVIFDEISPLNLIKYIRPDILIKGGDYTKDNIIGSDFVESYGGKIYVAKYYDEFSTTSIINKLKVA